MNLVSRLCPPEKYPIKCPYTRTPDRIVVHNTANDAPAENEASYMLNNDREVSFHYAVDDVEAIQCLPLERNAWASGDGRGPGNMNGIHIEICWSLSGGERFTQAERNTAELIARLLHGRGWGLDRVTKHQDYDGKYCPHRTLDLGWGRFLAMVEEKLRQLEKEEERVSYEEFKAYMKRYEAERDGQAVSSWAKEGWEALTARGVFDGTMPRGPLTREQAAAVICRLERESAPTP